MSKTVESKSISDLLNSYKLSETAPLRILRESSDNQVWLIGDKNKNILRLSKRLPLEDIKFEYEALAHFVKNNFSVPVWVKTKKGELFIVRDGFDAAIMFKFIEGFQINISSKSSAYYQQIHAAGSALANLSEIGKLFKLEATRHRNIFSELERALHDEDVFKRDFKDGDIFIKQVRQAIKFGQESKSAVGLIHNDYRPSNVLFKNNPEVSGVIDFDWSCIGSQIKDLALAVLEWSYLDGNAEPDFTAFDIFLEGYNSVATEKYIKGKELYSWIMFSALSDASTYFCDRLNQSNLVKDIYSSFMYKKYLYFSQL